jgi:transposase
MEHCDKNATLLSVSRMTVSTVMSAYTNHGKKTSAKSNSGRKSTMTERDHRTLRRIVSKKKSENYCSTDDSRTEDPISTKTV